MAKAPSPLSRLNLAGKVGIGALLFVLTGGVYFVVFHSDMQTSTDAEVAKKQKLNEELKKAEAAKEAYQKDLAELTDREQRQRDLNKILPKTTEYPAFLSAIQGVANVAGVSLTAWTPKPEEAEKFYARVPMELKLSGRYHQVAKFFYLVGQLDRIINIENISMLDPTMEGDDILLNVNALATAFHLLEVKTESGAKGRKKRRGKKK